MSMEIFNFSSAICSLTDMSQVCYPQAKYSGIAERNSGTEKKRDKKNSCRIRNLVCIIIEVKCQCI